MAKRVTVNDRAEARRIITGALDGACLIEGLGALQAATEKLIPICWTGPEDRAVVARLTVFNRLMAQAQQDAWLDMHHTWVALGPEAVRAGENALGVGRLDVAWRVHGVEREHVALAFILPDALPFLARLAQEHTFLLFGALPAALEGQQWPEVVRLMEQMDGLAIDLGGDVRDLVMTILEYERLGVPRGTMRRMKEESRG